jgi:hypothetical protein
VPHGQADGGGAAHSEVLMPARLNSSPRRWSRGRSCRDSWTKCSRQTNRRCPIELLLAEMPGEIQADERLLQHIFTNLLTNGVKYSDPGRAVRFEIAFAGTEIICAIRDQGIGIPEVDREWLFSAAKEGLARPQRDHRRSRRYGAQRSAAESRVTSNQPRK